MTKNTQEQGVVCALCGQAIKGGDYEELDDQLLCQDCLEEHTLLCTECGGRIWNDDNA